MSSPDGRPKLPPLCVDLDGTLVAADTLIESALLLLRRKPWMVPLIPLWLLGGKSRLKERIAREVSIDCARLPYRVDLVRFLESQRGRRQLILATAANERIAYAVARHLGLFDAVLASDETRNLKGLAKLEAIRGEIGGGEFDYMGDSLDDLPVFKAARRAVLVYPRSGIREKTAAECRVHHVMDGSNPIDHMTI